MKEHQRNNYIWNTIAGIINASEAVVLLAVVTRTNSIHDAGILTIAFAVANLFSNVGKFGMRNYQVTDIQGQFDFSSYFTSRVITTLGMFAVIIQYILYGFCFKHYAIDKAGTMFFVCLIYTSETVEDVFAGLYQKKGRLDISGIIFSVRWICTLTVITSLLIYTQNMLLAFSMGALISIIACIGLIYCANRYMNIDKYVLKFKGVLAVLSACFPLFLVAFLQFYLINASKYAIDRYLSEEVQACYGFVAMPVFVIGLLNSFMYQPVLVQMASQWKNKDMKEFIGRIGKQLGIITLITIICLVGAYLIGIPVLSALYNTDLCNYKSELLILLLGGAFLAVIGFATVLLTTMRKQKWILYAYIITAILTFIFTDKAVALYGAVGAAYSFLTVMGLLSTVLIILIVIFLNSVEHQTEESN